MFAPRTEHIYKHWGKGGGGGTRIIYCIRGSSVRAQSKKGGLRCWHSAKNGGLSCGHNQKEGGGGASSARCGYKPEIGICKKRGSHRNWSWSKGGYLELIYLLSSLLTGGVCSGRLKKGGLQCGPNSKKGVLGAGQVKKGGGVLYRDTHL